MIFKIDDFLTAFFCVTFYVRERYVSVCFTGMRRILSTIILRHICFIGGNLPSRATRIVGLPRVFTSKYCSGTSMDLSNMRKRYKGDLEVRHCWVTCVGIQCIESCNWSHSVSAVQMQGHDMNPELDVQKKYSECAQLESNLAAMDRVCDQIPLR